MKIIELAVAAEVDSDKAGVAANDADVADREAATTEAAKTLVASLRAAGVNVQRASLTFAGRPGSHEGSQTLDLAAVVSEVAAPVVVAEASPVADS